MKHTHLTDDQLIAMYLEKRPASPDQAGARPGEAPRGEALEHADTNSDVRIALDGCPACETRRAELVGLLSEIAETAASTADAAFPPERLIRQQARILHRLDINGHVGRVIAFPVVQAQRASRMHPNPVRRWVAAAAAAGLLIGMVAGHLAHQLPGFGTASPSQQTALAQTSRPFASHPVSADDDEFLREVETAVSSGPAGLRRLDRITPVAWAE